MTNELEKQFFDTFGIEPKLTFYNLIKVKENDTTEYSTRCTANYNNESKEETIRRHSSNGWKVIKCEDIYTYPQITDRILLELICILTEWRQYCASDYIIKAINIDILKNDILKDCLYMSNWYEFKKCGKDIKHQVRTLFEEG